LGKWTVILDAGMPICQLILEEVREMPETGYRGQFNAQTSFTAYS
jgi:deoxycytidine triphosphate deaminase